MLRKKIVEREAMAQRADVLSKRSATQGSHVRVIAVTSGKGGVGKTNIAANLAYGIGKYRFNPGTYPQI